MLYSKHMHWSEVHVLEGTEPFALKEFVNAHGWRSLAPFHWDAGDSCLSHVRALPGGGSGAWHVTQAAPTEWRVTLQAAAPLCDSDREVLLEGVRWALRLDESFAGFHALCRDHAPLRRAAVQGQGRLLRSPDLWEDLVKTLCTTCTTWARTQSMVRALCDRWGELELATERRTFPTPVALAAAGPHELRAAGLGYRADTLYRLAERLVSGELDPNTLRSSDISTDAVRRALIALPGIGPYAAGNLLMLLGRYDHLAIDSWLRRVVREGWFSDRTDLTDAEIERAFQPFGSWKALVYWFWDWSR